MKIENLMKLIAKVESIKLVADNTFEAAFYIDGFNFKAGQYVTVTLPNLKNLETREQFRDFSVVSSPNELPLLRIVMRKSETAFRQELFGMKNGEEIVLEGPAGIFTLPNDFERSIVFIAGGVGISPFLSMMKFITDNKMPYSITLAYFNRSIGSSAYLPELDTILENNPRLRVIKILGLLEEKYIVPLINQNPLWYIAGPPGMVKAGREILTKLGIIDNDIKTEEFSGY